MSSLPIRVMALSKAYRIGSRKKRYDTLREQLVEGLRGMIPGAGGARRREANSPDDTTVWALKDVSLEIEQGEVVGFIGRNGAGKSTLLKILSRITEPTAGRVEIRGRIGTLLEVGAGFHGELTGRENVYLSGAVLGMKKREIDTKFDEIVDFAGVERFIDTPVKRYSSGMYVRLAFAVAAHLDPDILIVDEVLAVGDAAFRLKCLDKMQDIRDQGRTILFVSHNVDALTRMCERVFLMDGGRLLRSGLPHDVVPYYLAATRDVGSEKVWEDAGKAPGNEVVRLRKVRVRTEEGRTIAAHDIRAAVGIEAEYEVLKPGYILTPNFHFSNQDGLLIFVLQDVSPRWRRQPRPPGLYTSTAWIPGNFLAEGGVMVDVAVSSHVPANILHFLERRAVGFQVIDSHDGDSARGDFKGPIPGVVRPVVQWSTEFWPDKARNPWQNAG